MIITRAFDTPYGELVLGSFGDTLCLCDWRHRRMRPAVDARIQKGLNAGFQDGTSPVIDEAIAQLNGYFKKQRTSFDLPLRLVGSEFQERVWNALMHVPYGTTTTYAALTDRVAEPSAIRAVAAANGANALSIIVPCHRVVGSSGELVGYAGGLAAKKKLLELEGARSRVRDLFDPVEEEL